MTYILASSKQSSNVITETNINNFIFHSAYNTFKIVASGVLNQSVPASTNNTYSISHGLSYTPLVYAFCKVDSGSVAVTSYEGADFTSFPHTYFFRWAGADSSNVNFYLENYDGSSHTFSLKYYIFEVPQ